MDCMFLRIRILLSLISRSDFHTELNQTIFSKFQSFNLIKPVSKDQRIHESKIFGYQN